MIFTVIIRFHEKNGGSDNYGNLVLVTEVIHKLLHAVRSETVERLLCEISLNDKQIAKLNTLRVKNNLDKI